jgi:hypothetical protein
MRSYLNRLSFELSRVQTKWASEGRWFKSSRPDHKKQSTWNYSPGAFLLSERMPGGRPVQDGIVPTVVLAFHAFRFYLFPYHPGLVVEWQPQMSGCPVGPVGILPPPAAAHPARHKQIKRISMPFEIFMTLSFRASVPHHHVFRCPEAIIVFLLENKLQQKDDVFIYVFSCEILSSIRSVRDSTELQAFPALSGCWYAAAGAGAAVTYYAVEKGYKVQTPVTHETPKKQQDKQ